MQDINECDQYGVCSQGCFNLQGSYKCVCMNGFQLNEDNRTCLLKSHEEPLLLFVTNEAINAYYLKSHRQTTVIKSIGQLIGVGYDEDMVYYTDNSKYTEKILRVGLNGENNETLLTSGLSAPEDIAVDHYTGNIYFTDYDLMHIAVCSNNGLYCVVLVNQDVHRPRGIVLYPQKGLMYWSDWGFTPMISVSNMDGSESKSLVSKELEWPNGLALDWPNERLYWVDAKRLTIESVRLDGSDRRKVLGNLAKSPHGIAVFQDSIYWSDVKEKSIEYCDKFTGKHRKTLVKDRKIYGK